MSRCDPCLHAGEESLRLRNRMQTRSLIAIAAVQICLTLEPSAGCHRRRWEDLPEGTGDAGQFILRQALACGARPVGTTNLPAVAGLWRYSQDDNGVVMRFRREDYEVVESFLRSAFGEPSFGPSVNTDGGRTGGYRLSARGGAIQFGYDADGTQVIIICVRPTIASPGSSWEGEARK